MRQGDLVVVPLLGRRGAAIGVIDGDYTYRPAEIAKMRHARKVRWLRTTDRARCSMKGSVRSSTCPARSAGIKGTRRRSRTGLIARTCRSPRCSTRPTGRCAVGGTESSPTSKPSPATGNWKAPLAAPPPETARSGGTPGLVGTAVDYRVRWLWPHGTAADLVGVGHGAYTTFSRERGDQFAVEVDELACRYAGPGCWDITEASDQLARLALVIGQLEAAWRSRLPLDAASGIHADADLAAMLAAQREDLVADICNIVNIGRTHLAPLLGVDVILNPVFEQSLLVGGEDADFVAGGCLVELKTTSRPSMPSNEVRQLVTYACDSTTSTNTGSDRSPSSTSVALNTFDGTLTTCCTSPAPPSAEPSCPPR